MGNNIFKDLPKRIKESCPNTKKIAIIFDSKVPSHKKHILSKLKNYDVLSYNFKSSEKVKSIKSVINFLNKLLSKILMRLTY